MYMLSGRTIPEEKFLTKIEGSYQLSINWVGNDKVSINGQSFLLRDGIIQKIVS